MILACNCVSDWRCFSKRCANRRKSFLRRIACRLFFPSRMDHLESFMPHPMVARIANSSAEMASPASDTGVDSDVLSEPSMQESSNIDSDSDSLHSTASRKRRKVSPAINDSLDQDDSPLASRIWAPSRIKVQFKDSVLNNNPPCHAILAPTDPHTTFQSLNVKSWLVGSLSSMAIKRPTGIQKGCIPQILKGRDCIGGSRTGSGKTVAFAVPILQKWAKDPIGIFAVILTPTRYSYTI
jgi:ATP-dependent RNA helicase DDX49/DBP8